VEVRENEECCESTGRQAGFFTAFFEFALTGDKKKTSSEAMEGH